MTEAERFLKETDEKLGCAEVVYISGKMTGLPDLGRSAFAEAEKLLEEQGYIVLNPAVLPDGLAKEAYMPICLAMLQAADWIYMLPGWEDSEGAKIELAYARYQHKKVTFAE